VIDDKGLRANVGIILLNNDKQVLWARRVNADDAWQFPQGGINEGETPLEAMYRELEEELGLKAESVEHLAVTDDWLVYYLPKRFRRYNEIPMCIGQKQKWFLLKLTGDDSAIQLDLQDKPEFDTWAWTDYWHPIKNVITFKQDVYRKALRQLAVHAGVPRP
jgi:putative (di)nucleoside polyphosphate hydrolase